jgi:hypothetical protein
MIERISSVVGDVNRLDRQRAAKRSNLPAVAGDLRAVVPGMKLFALGSVGAAALGMPFLANALVAGVTALIAGRSLYHYCNRPSLDLAQATRLIEKRRLPLLNRLKNYERNGFDFKAQKIFIQSYPETFNKIIPQKKLQFSVYVLKCMDEIEETLEKMRRGWLKGYWKISSVK